jgi:hypothetical protein
LFPKWMERLKQEVREEEFWKAVREQAEAREGGLGTKLVIHVRQNSRRE